mgnify:CR=1 FL=1
METPKIKAEQLLDKYYKLFSVDLENTISEYEAIECAKIAVEELIKESSDRTTTIRFKGCNLTDKEYWQEVKTELNKL